MTFAQAQPMNQTSGAPRPGAMPSVRLLIVEDDTSLATGLMRALSNEGYDVAAAVNADDEIGVDVDGPEVVDQHGDA